MHPSDLTLAQYFEQVYLPAEFTPSQGQYVEYHRRALQLFERFAGQVTIGAMTPEKLDEFATYCNGWIGHNDSPRKIRKMMRHVRPAEFPRNVGAG